MSEIIKSNTITSMEVAEMVGKEHKKLLRDIRVYIAQLDESKIGLTDFFTESQYIDKSNRQKPCYLVTKKGCEFIAHKLTGIKGTEFTAKYINRFHEMEDELVTRPRPMTALEQLQLQAQAILEVNDKVVAMKTELEDVKQELAEFKQDLPLLAVDQSKITSAVKMRVVVILGGKHSNACNSYYIRSKVFQSLYKDLYSYFAIRSYKAIKRSELDEALEFINDYNPPKHIQQWIADANAQMNLSELED